MEQCNKELISEFFNITDGWALSSNEEWRLLGQIPKSTFYRYKKTKQGRLSNNIKERIEVISGIDGRIWNLYVVGGAYAPPYLLIRLKHNLNQYPMNWGIRMSILDIMLHGQVMDLYTARDLCNLLLNNWSERSISSGS